MKDTLHMLRQTGLFRAAMIAPIAIMLIFSFFNLSAPMDPVRTASAFRLGIVNADEGLAFPPIKVSERVMAGMGERLPFSVVPLSDMGAARAALDAGDVAAVIHFPPEFSEAARGSDPVPIEILAAQHLTVSETQIAAQLPMSVELALSAGIASLRAALASGQMPSMAPVVAAKVEMLHPAPKPAAVMAAQVMVFATWLAALVGGLLLVLASGKAVMPDRVMVRIAMPVVGMGLAALGLALVIGGTVGWELFLPVWLSVWGAALCLHWFMGGVIAVLSPLAMIVLLPLAFYQSVIGGTLTPLAAAPAWLGTVGSAAPFERLGAGYRSIVYGLPESAAISLPWAWLLVAGVIGIALHLIAGFARRG